MRKTTSETSQLHMVLGTFKFKNGLFCPQRIVRRFVVPTTNIMEKRLRAGTVRFIITMLMKRSECITERERGQTNGQQVASSCLVTIYLS